MKKSLLALAVLGAFTGVASAQSSVTLFGTIDVGGRVIKADGQKRAFSEETNSLNSSQLGFRGVEDLGGGLKAGFTLLSDVNANSGTAGNAAGKFFSRRSTVSLFGPFGEFRLGRDYTPTFWSQTIFDAFGTNGVGSSLNVRQMYAGTRQDNTIGYFLPSNLGGFYGQAMVGAANGVSGGAGYAASGDRNARYLGGRLGFAAGPFDIALAASAERFAGALAASGATANPPFTVAIPAGGTQRTYNAGASYDLGVLKLMGYWDHEKLNNGPKEDVGSISAVIPLGQSEIHVGYDRSKFNGVGPDTAVDQIKATYQYNLSKRTALYATASRLDNKDNTRLTLPGGTSAGLTTVSGKSYGGDFGIRHFF